eukprot:SAG22_NODE_291_length_12933_cov_5.599657_10_plen_346_part_00
MASVGTASPALRLAARAIAVGRLLAQRRRSPPPPPPRHQDRYQRRRQLQLRRQQHQRQRQLGAAEQQLDRSLHLLKAGRLKAAGIAHHLTLLPAGQLQAELLDSALAQGVGGPGVGLAYFHSSLLGRQLPVAGLPPGTSLSGWNCADPADVDALAGWAAEWLDEVAERMRECGVPPSSRTFRWLLKRLVISARDEMDGDTIERGFAVMAAMEQTADSTAIADCLVSRTEFLPPDGVPTRERLETILGLDARTQLGGIVAQIRGGGSSPGGSPGGSSSSSTSTTTTTTTSGGGGGGSGGDGSHQLWAYASLLNLCAERAGGGIVEEGEIVVQMARLSAGDQVGAAS